MFRVRWKTLSLFFILPILLLLSTAASAEAPNAERPEAPEENPTTPGAPAGMPGQGIPDHARDKIHPNLRREVEQAPPDKSLHFVARIAAGTDLSPYAGQWFARPFVDPLGNTVAAGFAKPTGIRKMATLDGVLFLQRSESLVEPPKPVDPDIEATLNANIEPQINTDAEASPGPAPEGWYHTTGALHGSQEAWDKGYTGAGVRYMSNDSGADYCHPDLFGTWAYIEDESSPYYGLPEMFDSYSSYQAALDFNLGMDRIASGRADYADTSTVISVPMHRLQQSRGTLNALFQPIGAPVVRTFKLPKTSMSGEYHIGSHPDKALAAVAPIINRGLFPGAAMTAQGERAGVLVVDENTPGVYDTVYVDLNYNYDFTDDEPARLTRDFSHQEAACLDYDGDGLNDISGGLVYFISDGSTAVPTLDWLWGIPGSFFGNGDLVAFHVQDFAEPAGSHGQGTTSVATGQGVVAGSVFLGPGGYDVADNMGLVVGPGKDVVSTQNGNFYISPFIEDAYIYAGLGYDATPGTGDDVQIMSNSWGFSGVDNDGWDFISRLIDAINRLLAPNTALLFSTGNGAAGYGTVAPPSPPSGIGVGASTEYGSIGLFESIASADQIRGGDPMSWSNRGPGARNIAGVDVVATGAFGTGDLSLNQVLWGAVATANFGGTSMASPVAAGNLALTYQAWYDRTGSWPTFAEARELLMGTSKNTDHDVWTQGAGLVDADEGTDVAGGHDGTYATPSEWSVGDYRGTEYPGFAHIISPGESDTQTFTLHNTSDSDLNVSLATNRFTRIGATDYSFTTLDEALDHGAFTTPDYAFQIDGDIPAGTDMLMVRVNKPHEQFDPNEDLFGPFSNWRVHLQNWTDLDGDGNFWEDANGNGKVDLGEMDANEHIRFTYGYNTGPTQQARISNPLERMDDGVLLTFRHRDKAGVTNTDLTVEASYWQRATWDWIAVPGTPLTIPAGGSATFDATISVPAGAAHGMYQGSIVVSDGQTEVVIPVTAAVAASGTSFDFGGAETLADALYDNSHVFGYTDYAWRAESGDWRFFWTDIAEGDLPASGSPFLVVDNAWSSSGTDIDTIVLGPTPDGFAPESYYGPYTLAQVGRSANNYIGSGRWVFQTSSGGPREIISAPAQEGLHGLLFHQVRVDTTVADDPFVGLDEPFGGSAGLVTLDPGAVTASGPAGMGTMEVSISSEIALNNFVGEGFGLGTPTTTTETVNQDDPNDPSTASFSTEVEINHAARLEVSTANSGGGSDIDLYVYDPDGNLAGASTTPDDTETVSILFPQDGTWRVDVHGWSVPAGTDTFELTINAIQGFDVPAAGLPDEIPAGGTATFQVAWDASGFDPGTYFGLVLLGPADAPGLLAVPVEITVQ
ncbi:MAG: S8 family serine peptidase [Candidatus Promineifilaceae bacterium]|nr:S8 family serine peptidase [Candidatus Promineifilaceae bacterium]